MSAGNCEVIEDNNRHEPSTEPGGESEEPKPQRTPPPSQSDSELPSRIPEQDRLQADPRGTKEWRSPLKRKNPCTKRSGDGAEPKSLGKPPPSEGPSRRRPIWISERDWLEAGPSGTQQRRIPSKRYKSSAKISGVGEKPKTQGTLQSSRTAPSKRPSRISNQDWLDAAPLGTKSGSSPSKTSGRRHKSAKTSAPRATTTTAGDTASGLPRRHLKYPEDLSSQCEHVTNLGIWDADEEDWEDHVVPEAVDTVQSGEGQPSEADPVDLFVRAFDEMVSSALASQEIIASWCAPWSDDDESSGDDPPS